MCGCRRQGIVRGREVGNGQGEGGGGGGEAVDVGGGGQVVFGEADTC